MINIIKNTFLLLCSFYLPASGMMDQASHDAGALFGITTVETGEYKFAWGGGFIKFFNIQGDVKNRLVVIGSIEASNTIIPTIVTLIQDSHMNYDNSGAITWIKDLKGQYSTTDMSISACSSGDVITIKDVIVGYSPDRFLFTYKGKFYNNKIMLSKDYRPEYMEKMMGELDSPEKKAAAFKLFGMAQVPSTNDLNEHLSVLVTKLTLLKKKLKKLSANLSNLRNELVNSPKPSSIAVTSKTTTVTATVPVTIPKVAHTSSVKSQAFQDLPSVHKVAFQAALDNISGTIELDLSPGLSGPSIKHLPSEIGLLKNLKRLNLSCNIELQLPDEIGNLKNLEALDLSLVSPDLPSTFVNLKKLKKLKLGLFEEAWLPILCELTSLNVLQVIIPDKYTKKNEWVNQLKNSLNNLKLDECRF